MAELTREQFLTQVVGIIKERFPLVKIARGGTGFSLLLNGHVASLENLYRIALLAPDEVGHHVQRWVVELLRAGEGAPEEAGSLDEVRDRLLPILLSEAPTEIDSIGIVSQPIVSGLRVAYAIDQQRTISYLPKTVFDRWGIDLEALHELAVANLVARSEAVQAHAAPDETGEVCLVLFQSRDGYDAARLLLPTLHERLRTYLGSPFVAAVPSRDYLVCFRNEPELVQKLTTQIEADFRRMPHQITDQLFLVTADGIAPR
jgi:hypothetical protein